MALSPVDLPGVPGVDGVPAPESGPQGPEGVPGAPGVPAAPPARFDDRDPTCVSNWPECHTFGYDPRCCRFPKSCSAGTVHVEEVSQ